MGAYLLRRVAPSSPNFMWKKKSPVNESVWEQRKIKLRFMTRIAERDVRGKGKEASALRSMRQKHRVILLYFSCISCDTFHLTNSLATLISFCDIHIPCSSVHMTYKCKFHNWTGIERAQTHPMLLRLIGLIVALIGDIWNIVEWGIVRRWCNTNNWNTINWETFFLLPQDFILWLFRSSRISSIPGRRIKCTKSTSLEDTQSFSIFHNYEESLSLHFDRSYWSLWLGFSSSPPPFCH